MSVPVRYSANIVDNNVSEEMQVNAMEAEVRDQWMMIPGRGRLGIPGAAAEEQRNINMPSQTAELDAMTTDVLYMKLNEYYTLEDKYHICLILPQESTREITAGARDGSAYVLRSLKVWYELPSDVLFAAINLVDRFLDKMTVKPKHMACISVASFHLAVKQLQMNPLNLEDLVTISQCGCTAGDLERMAGVIASKLGVQIGFPPVNTLSFLRLYYVLFRRLAYEMGGMFFDYYEQVIKLEELEMAMEILLCDVKTSLAAPSTLALALICHHLEHHLSKSYQKEGPELMRIADYALFLQNIIGMPNRVFVCAHNIVSQILYFYNNQHKMPYRQRLVWRLSTRTMRALRPTNKLTSHLPTIEEHKGNHIDENLPRSRTESSSSEEEEDWPTSLIIPIFEQC